MSFEWLVTMWTADFWYQTDVRSHHRSERATLKEYL